MWKAALALTLVALALLVATHLHTYAGLNAGIVVDIPGGHWLGLEVRGQPGLFWDVS